MSAAQNRPMWLVSCSVLSLVIWLPLFSILLSLALHTLGQAGPITTLFSGYYYWRLLLG